MKAKLSEENGKYFMKRVLVYYPSTLRCINMLRMFVWYMKNLISLFRNFIHLYHSLIMKICIYIYVKHGDEREYDS